MVEACYDGVVYVVFVEWLLLKPCCVEICVPTTPATCDGARSSGNIFNVYPIPPKVTEDKQQPMIYIILTCILYRLSLLVI